MCVGITQGGPEKRPGSETHGPQEKNGLCGLLDNNPQIHSRQPQWRPRF